MDDLPSWEAEYRRLPGSLPITCVLVAGALVAALVLVAQLVTDSGHAGNIVTTSLACAELARLRAHGVTSGPWVDRVRVACTRAGGR